MLEEASRIPARDRASSALPIASIKASVLLACALRRMPIISLKASSIGLRSGE